MIHPSVIAAAAPPLAAEVTKSSLRDAYFLGIEELAVSTEHVWISSGQETRLVNFEHILGGGDFLRDANSCLRYVIFRDKEARKALATVDILSQGGQQVPRCTKTGPAVEEIPNVLRIAAKLSEKQKIDYAVRFVEIGAMQLEVIWMNELYNGKEDACHSYFIPLLTSAGFVKRRIYTREVFRAKLITSARKQRSKRRSKPLLASNPG